MLGPLSAREDLRGVKAGPIVRGHSAGSAGCLGHNSVVLHWRKAARRVDNSAAGPCAPYGSLQKAGLELSVPLEPSNRPVLTPNASSVPSLLDDVPVRAAGGVHEHFVKGRRLVVVPLGRVVGQHLPNETKQNKVTEIPASAIMAYMAVGDPSRPFGIAIGRRRA